MQKGYQALLYQNPHNQKSKFPRVIALGGDHTITLPILRSIHAAYGPVSVIHFDSHLDTWSPYGYYDDSPDEGSLNHGTYFYYASEEGLIKKGESIHAGIRSPLVEADDYKVRSLFFEFRLKTLIFIIIE
jgi:agmatinase